MHWLYLKTILLLTSCNKGTLTGQENCSRCHCSMERLLMFPLLSKIPNLHISYFHVSGNTEFQSIIFQDVQVRFGR